MPNGYIDEYACSFNFKLSTIGVSTGICIHDWGFFYNYHGYTAVVLSHPSL